MMMESKDDSTPAPPAKNAADARYSFNHEKLAKLRTDSPWTKETKYLTSVAISPSAIMKMVSQINQLHLLLLGPISWNLSAEYGSCSKLYYYLLLC